MTREDPITDALIAARLLRPYYAVALAALRPVPTPGLGTCAVDTSWRLYYDPEWLASLSIDVQATVIAGHEVEHLLRDHAGRRSGRDKMLWNIAGDAEINDDIQVLPSWVTPAAIGAKDGLMAEEYYDHCDHCSGGKTCGGGSGAGVPQDYELEPDDMSSGSESIRQMVAADVRAYVEAVGPDSVPAGIVVWANKVGAVVPKDWRRDLAMEVGRRSREIARGRMDFSWARPARRRAEVLRPAMVAYAPKVAMVVDTSGSMEGVAEYAIGVASGILRSFGSVDVYCCDTEVYKGRSVWRGGGGTDMRAGITAAKDADIVVVVTDGETPWPTEKPEVPVVVVLLKDSTTAPAWAKVVKVTP